MADPLDELDAVAGISKTPATSQKMKLRPSRIEGSMDRLAKVDAKLRAAAEKHLVPYWILAGIADRESGVGAALDKSGWDMGKNAFGIMQVDKRYHTVKGKTPDSQAHFDQAAEILRQARNDMDRNFPNDTDEQRWQSAIAAYNTGAGHVKSFRSRDNNTTGHDYSADVWQRAIDYRDRTDSRIVADKP